jgi:hypothetical protein
MVAKVRIVVMLTLLCVPLMALAQSSGQASNSGESLYLQDVADGSIVMLSKEDSAMAGYINVQYAFVHSDCPGGAQVVYYSGPAFDIKDPAVLKNERKKCSHSMYETGGDD